MLPVFPFYELIKYWKETEFHGNLRISWRKQFVFVKSNSVDPFLDKASVMVSKCCTMHMYLNFLTVQMLHMMKKTNFVLLMLFLHINPNLFYQKLLFISGELWESFTIYIVLISQLLLQVFLQFWLKEKIGMLFN